MRAKIEAALTPEQIAKFHILWRIIPTGAETRIVVRPVPAGGYKMRVGVAPQRRDSWQVPWKTLCQEDLTLTSDEARTLATALARVADTVEHLTVGEEGW